MSLPSFHEVHFETHEMPQVHTNYASHMHAKKIKNMLRKTQCSWHHSNIVLHDKSPPHILTLPSK